MYILCNEDVLSMVKYDWLGCSPTVILSAFFVLKMHQNDAYFFRKLEKILPGGNSPPVKIELLHLGLDKRKLGLLLLLVFHQ